MSTTVATPILADYDTPTSHRKKDVIAVGIIVVLLILMIIMFVLGSQAAKAGKSANTYYGLAWGAMGGAFVTGSVAYFIMK